MLSRRLNHTISKTLGVRYATTAHREIDDAVKSIGLRNTNIIRNPT